MESKFKNIKTTKKERTLLKDIRIGTENEMVTNPFSGVEVELCPEAVAIYDVIRGCQRTLDITFNYLEEIEELLYAAKSVFIKNWPEHYMTLLD